MIFDAMFLELLLLTIVAPEFMLLEVIPTAMHVSLCDIGIQ